MGGHPEGTGTNLFCGNFRHKGCYHVVKADPLVGNVLCGELGLDLRKPNFWNRWPKWWNLDGHCWD